MNIISLFAGCGGLDYGFEKAGFKIIWANEFDKTIHETYIANHPDTILNTSDIRSLTGADIPDCDGIIGGPPCQSWSEGGKSQGIEDPRGKLFLDYIRIVNDKKPKFFIIENVKGLLSEKHRNSLNMFLRMLDNAGYNITYELLNAADYKIPQDRHRVFFVGIRKDLPNRFEFPDTADLKHISLRQSIGDIVEKPNYFKEGDIVYPHSSRINHDVYIGPYDSKYMARNRVRSWEETSFTILAKAKNIPLHPQAPKMTYVSYSRRIFAKGYEHLYRRLSVRECARIQSFPDSFVFIYKDIVNGYKMVGNAVPPRLSWYLAIQIKKAFGNYSNSTNKHDSEKKIIPISADKIAREYAIITRNEIARTFPNNYAQVNYNKHVLISLVKTNFVNDFINRNARIYYTGKYFPSIVSLKELYYFIPYIKNKGIRDLYYIKAVTTGTKQDYIKNSNDDSQRLIFEIVFVKQLFQDYIPVHLNIWRTFTDTILANIVSINSTGDQLLNP